MVMDLGLVAVTAAGQVITHSLTYNASITTWELRFCGNGDNVIFHNGALLSEEGVELVPPSDVWDFLGVWLDILEALRTGGKSDFELASVLPAMNFLQRAADAIGAGR